MHHHLRIGDTITHVNHGRLHTLSKWVEVIDSVTFKQNGYCVVKDSFDYDPACCLRKTDTENLLCLSFPKLKENSVFNTSILKRSLNESFSVMNQTQLIRHVRINTLRFII